MFVSQWETQPYVRRCLFACITSSQSRKCLPDIPGHEHDLIFSGADKSLSNMLVRDTHSHPDVANTNFPP
jgi:hypothetical protein